MKKLFLMIAVFILMVAVPAYPADKKGVAAVEKNEFKYDDHDKRDPFWKLIGSRGMIVSYDQDIQVAEMVLEGVMAEPEGGSVAIINGNIVKPNDKVGHYIIKEINVNTVILEKGKEIYTLKLKKED